MVNRGHGHGKTAFDVAQLAERQTALVELPSLQTPLGEVADEAFNPAGRGVDQGPAGDFHGVGQHQHGGLLGLRLGARIADERRHGWQGKLENLLTERIAVEDYKHPDWTVRTPPGGYLHAVVVSAEPQEIRARAGADDVVLKPEDWNWTGLHSGEALVKPGDVIYVRLAEQMEGAARRATLEQDSGAQGSLLAIDNSSGDVLAMVGGRDYALSQFNRATQAQRQTGSSFKPYVYTAAIEGGAKPEDIIVDGPISFGSYTPHNYENDYKGAMTLTNAFAESRNIPALKLAARVGIEKVIEVAHRFGVTTNIPAYLPVALGAVEITLEEQVASYSVFPNDGLRVTPRLIRKVQNADGITLWEDTPAVSEVIGRETSRTMLGLLRAVTQHGTGAAAAQLNHPLGGKTGTTSDYTDAWFLGFSPSITCGVWVGYDNNQSLGEKETGARAALPIWMTLMRAAIAGKDDERFMADETNGSAQQSAAEPPANAVAKPTAALAASGTAIKPAKQLSVVSRPAAASSPAGPSIKAPAQPAHKPPAQPAPGVATAKSQVKPALPRQTFPVKSAATVKPALDSALDPAKRKMPPE